MSEKQDQSTMNDPTLDVVVSVLHELESADLKRIAERNDVNQAIQHHVSTCDRCQRLIEYEDPLFVHARRLRERLVDSFDGNEDDVWNFFFGGHCGRGRPLANFHS